MTKSERTTVIVVGAVVLVGAIAAVFLLKGSTVDGKRFKGRAHMGNVSPEFFRLADRWDDVGTHEVRVPSPEETAAIGLPPAGAREGAAAAAAQLAAYNSGASGARTLDETPHGAGVGMPAEAIDVWPAGFNPRIGWDKQPEEIRARFLAFGAFAEREGFAWGGRWRSARFPHGDQPHVETLNWRGRRAQRKAVS